MYHQGDWPDVLKINVRWESLPYQLYIEPSQRICEVQIYPFITKLRSRIGHKLREPSSRTHPTIIVKNSEILVLVLYPLRVKIKAKMNNEQKTIP